MKTYTQDELTRITALPSTLGRHIGQQFMGQPYHAHPWVLYMEREILAMLFRPGNEILIVSVPPQNGKLLTLSERLPTPSGWTTMGKVQVGDELIGADGRPCRVVGVSAVERRRVHRLVFDDGSTIDAGPEHQWTTFDNRERSAYGDGARRAGRPQSYEGPWWDWASPGSSRGGDSKSPSVRTTEELLESLRCEGGSKANHSIPNTHGLQLPDVDLPVDPWVLGYWLGNGARGTGTVTTGGRNGCDPDVLFVQPRTGGSARITGKHKATITVPGLITQLKSLGIAWTKEVPDPYMRASSDQRLALLRGLMDSDGTNEGVTRIGTSGSASFSSNDLHLANAVAELAVSLGAKVRRDSKRAKLNGVDHGEHFRVTFTPPFCPFSLPRKVDRWSPAENTGRGLNRHHRKIVDIQVLDEVAEMRCVEVDGPGHLYLAGAGMIPTHNSTYCSMLLPAWYLGNNPGHQVINVSYNEKQASKWGLRTLNLIRQFGGPLFGIGINSDSDSKSDWKLDNGFGGMMSAGISNITGNPGHLIIADDLIPNAEAANSPIIKRKIMDDWDDSLTTRFQENTKVLVVATRWSEDDPSGELITRSLAPEYEGFPVSTLNIKALAEPDPDELSEMSEEELAKWTDFLGRHYGEGLKGQHSQAFFERKRASTPIGRWMSLHQGTPTFSIGGMFPEEYWKFWCPPETPVDGAKALPEIVKKVRVWDIASSEGSGDWTVGTLLGRSRDNEIFVLARERFQHAPGGVEKKISLIAETDGHAVPIRIEQERSGAGITVVDFYKRHLPGYNVDGLRAEGDKESRATPYSIMQNDGKVYLPHGAPWAKEWIKEHSQMDGKGRRPKHDDQIDTAAYGVRFLISSGDSTLWDPSAIQVRPDMTQEQREDILAIRALLGAG